MESKHYINTRLYGRFRSPAFNNTLGKFYESVSVSAEASELRSVDGLSWHVCLLCPSLWHTLQPRGRLVLLAALDDVFLQLLLLCPFRPHLEHFFCLAFSTHERYLDFFGLPGRKRTFQGRTTRFRTWSGTTHFCAYGTGLISPRYASRSQSDL